MLVLYKIRRYSFQIPQAPFKKKEEIHNMCGACACIFKTKQKKRRDLHRKTWGLRRQSKFGGASWAMTLRRERLRWTSLYYGTLKEHHLSTSISGWTRFSSMQYMNHAVPRHKCGVPLLTANTGPRTHTRLEHVFPRVVFAEMH